MNEEEKKAVEELKKMYWYADEYEEEHLVEIVLNLIEKQQKEIEKKDRQIDLMAEFIDRVDIKDEHCKGYMCTVATTCYPEEERKEICLNCIKSRFREEAEEDK